MDNCDPDFVHDLSILITGLGRKVAKYDRDYKKLQNKLNKLAKSTALTQKGFDKDEEFRKLQIKVKKHKQFKNMVKEMCLPEIRKEENAFRLQLKRNLNRLKRFSIATHIRGISKRQHADFQTEVCIFCLFVFRTGDNVVTVTTLTP